jgi:hypothetical protein
MVLAGGEDTSRISTAQSPRRKCMSYAPATSATVKRLVTASASAIVVAAAVCATTGAGAQTVRPPDVPTQSVEMIAPAAAITSTVHYEATVPLTCNVVVCEGRFPRPGRNQLITATRLSCGFTVSNNSPIGVIHADVLKGNGTRGAMEYLPIDYTYPQGYNIINQAIDLQVVGREQLDLLIVFSAGNAAASSGACTATGTLSTMG